MFFYRWVSYLAITGFLLLAIQPSIGWSEEVNVITNEGQSSFDLSVIENAQIVWSKPACDVPLNQQQADFCQQERMAQAAEDALSLNKVQTIIGVVGGLLILATLFANIRAANAAKKSADTAERAFTHVERPWLVVDFCEVQWRTRPFNGPLPINDWFIVIYWKNIGRMPAIIGESILKIEEIGGLSSIPNYEGGQEMDLPRAMEGGAKEFTPSFSPPEQPFKDGKPTQFVVYGRVTYTELDRSRDHHTGFAVQVSPERPRTTAYSNEAYEYWD